jgi:hypothetical protein
MGQIKPRTLSELMDIASRFADGKDACNNKRTRSPEDDRENRYSSQRRRSRNYDNYGSHSQVAADIRTTPTKETTAEIQGTATMTEKIQATIKGSSQEDQGSTINHQMIC